jgi:hypothetical protein
MKKQREQKRRERQLAKAEKRALRKIAAQNSPGGDDQELEKPDAPDA